MEESAVDRILAKLREQYNVVPSASPPKRVRSYGLPESKIQLPGNVKVDEKPEPDPEPIQESAKNFCVSLCLSF